MNEQRASRPNHAKSVALQRVPEVSALAVTNPVVQVIAARNGWRSETLVRRVASALPAPVEQQLYLRIARSVRMHPESLAKILRTLLGQRTLQPGDMLDKAHGRNLYSNLFAETASTVGEVLTVTHALRAEYGAMPIDAATKLVMAYGPDQVETVADSMCSYIDEAFEDDTSREKHRAMALYWLATYGLAWCRDKGCPNPNDISEWFREHRAAKKAFHDYVGWPTRGWKGYR